MSFELKLALKYFRARRKSLARFTSVVAIVGIAVGVAALIIAQSLAKGFQDEMRDKILANTAHISIFHMDGGEISNWQDIKNNLEKTENIKEVLPMSFENALVIGENETSYAILKVQGSKFKIQGSEIAIGAKLAEKLNLKIGDSAEIITLENQTPQKIKIAETFETGLFDYDSTWIYVSPENFARLHNKQVFTPANLGISVKDIYKSNETANKIRTELGENFKIVDWQEANRPLFAALSLERKVSLAIISLIIFIAALNITTTLALLVNERRLDIAVLRTCGAKTSNLIKIFLLEGLFLGFVGIFCGVILGLLACFAGNYFKLVSISAEVYSLNYIPFHPQISNILLIILIAFAVCLGACVYPAFKASKIKPSENLRLQ
ncbi:MAG TPA: ABC transporter permease [Pyrinomonadaceae bacterium]|nr:ABC transporter permease [Pyrinomonadaceae bacterium]